MTKSNNIFLLILFSLCFTLLQPQQTLAAAGINKQINFQSKVVNTDGTNVTDGTYDFVFTIYNGAGSAANSLFTESWTAAALWSTTMTTAPASAGESLVYVSDTNEASLKVGELLTDTTKGETVVITSVNTATNTLGISPTSQAWNTSDTITNKIYVKNGIFRVALNSLNQNISGVDFNSDTIFLGVNFNADGEAKPRIQMAAAPYAFNANQVNGISFTGTNGNTYTFPSTTNGTVLTSNAPTQTITSTQTSGTVLGLTDSTTQTAAETGLAITLSGSGAFDQTGLSFNLSNATGTNLNDIVGTGSTWKIAKTGAFSLTPSSNTAGITLTGTNITSANLLNLSAANTSGTLGNYAFGSATTLAGALIGESLDLSTNVVATNQNETGIKILIDNPTNTNTSGTELLKGLVISAGGTITQNGAGGSTTFNGIDATIPTLTLTTGTALTGNGISVTGGNIIQTAGTVTENGILIDQSAATITTGGTLTGLQILPPTTAQASGTTRSIFLGTSTSSTANTNDSATISVGNIASTAQQNRTTLNIQNGGTGYFDLELVRGMINFQQTNFFDEEFTEKALDTTNRMTSTATGTTGLSCAIASGVVNGVYRMTTGTIANNRCDLSTLATLSNGFYQRGNNPIAEFNVKPSSATNGGQRMAFGFSAAVLGASDTLTTAHAYILKRSADTTWQCATSDGTTESLTSTGVTIDTTAYHRLRVTIQAGTTPQVICSIDGTSVSKTTNIPGATTAMDIYAKGETIDTTSETIDVDYARAWQDDPVPGIEVDNQEQTSQSDAELSPTPISNDTPTSFPSPTSSDNKTIFAALHITGESIFDGAVSIAKTLTSNLIVNGVSEFFDSVLFHKHVTFEQSPTFPNNTGGTATIKKGETSVDVHFAKDYDQTPIINVTALDGSTENQGQQTNDFLTQDYKFVIAKRSVHGFSIQLNKNANADMEFSWTALQITNSNNTQSAGTNQIIPSAIISPTQQPSDTPTETTTISPTIEAQ